MGKKNKGNRYMPKDQMSPYLLGGGIYGGGLIGAGGGGGKLIKPEDLQTDVVQGCGDPDCEMCMPKNGRGGGSKMGGGDGFRLGGGMGGRGNMFGGSGFEQMMMRAAREAAFGNGGFSVGDGVPAYVTYEPDSSSSSDKGAKRKAKEQEEELRPKVERFFLKTKHDTGWSDVIGNDAARTALVEAIEDPVKHKDAYAFYGMKPTKGVLLYGPPGCGKTMFGKACAGVLAALHKKKDADVTMMHVKGSEIQAPYVGVTEAIIRDIFAYAKAFKVLNGFPLVVFIDEADAILPSREGKGGRKALAWEESNVATFLTEMDGLEDSGAFVILATNRPDVIDEALLRDGRCDRKVKVERPGMDAAYSIISKGLSSAPLQADLSWESLSTKVVTLFFAPYLRIATLHHDKGQSDLTLGGIVNGAMLVGLVNRAKGIAFRRDLASGAKPTGIGEDDLIEAIKQVYSENLGLQHAAAVRELCEEIGVNEVRVESYREPKRAEPESLAA